MRTAALLLALSLPVTAVADEVVPLRCMSAPDDMQKVTAVEAQILGSFRATTSATLLDAKEIKMRTSPRSADDRLAAAQKAADAGRDAYRKLELDTAAAQLQSAQTQLRKLLPWLEDAELADILLDLGLVQIEQGKGGDAVTTFRLARYYGAPRALDPKFFPQAAMKSYAKGSAAAEGSGIGAIAVRTVPAGADVFVDGRAVGKSPVVVSQVVSGEHFVRVRTSEGHRSWTRVAVDGGRTARVTLRAPRAPISGDIALTGDPDRDFSRQLQTGEAVGARFILAYGVDTNGRLFIRVIDAFQGHTVFDEHVDGGSDPATLRELAKDAAATVDATSGDVQRVTVD